MWAKKELSTWGDEGVQGTWNWVGAVYLNSHQLHRPNDKCFKIKGNLEASSTHEKSFLEDAAQDSCLLLWCPCSVWESRTLRHLVLLIHVHSTTLVSSGLWSLICQRICSSKALLSLAPGTMLAHAVCPCFLGGLQQGPPGLAGSWDEWRSVGK